MKRCLTRSCGACPQGMGNRNAKVPNNILRSINNRRTRTNGNRQNRPNRDEADEVSNVMAGGQRRGNPRNGNRNSGNRNTRRGFNQRSNNNRQNRNSSQNRSNRSPSRVSNSRRNRSSSEDLVMINRLPQYDPSKPIEQHIDELYRIGKNNISVSIANRVYKTYICPHVAKDEPCPDMERRNRCKFAHSCEEQSFLIDPQVYQWMINSEGVFPAFIKNISERICEIDNYDFLLNYWHHWTGYIGEDSYRIRNDRCEWIPFGNPDIYEKGTFFSLLHYSNWGNKMKFDTYVPNLVSRDLSSILIDLVDSETERRRFIKESISNEIYKIVISFKSPKECEEFLKKVIILLSEYGVNDKEIVRIFSEVATKTFKIVHTDSDGKRILNNPYIINDDVELKDNVNKVKKGFRAIVNEKNLSGSKKRAFSNKMNKIQGDIIKFMVEYNDGNFETSLEFDINDHVNPDFKPSEVLDFIVQVVSRKLFVKSLSFLIKDHLRWMINKRTNTFSFPNMEPQYKIARESNVKQFFKLLKKDRVMNPKLYDFLKGNPYKIAQEEQRRSRICPKYRTYITRKFLGDTLTSEYSSAVDKRTFDRFNCFCTGGINCKHGLHLNTFISQEKPLDEVTPVGEADEVSGLLRFNIPESYNPYTNPSIKSDAVNQIFIKGRNVLSLEDYRSAYGKILNGSSEESIIEETKALIDEKVRSNFKCQKIGLKFQFVDSGKNIDSIKIREQLSIEDNSFKRWNSFQNEKVYLSKMFDNLKFLRSNPDSERSVSIREAFKSIFAKALKDCKSNSEIVSTVDTLLKERLIELKQNIYKKMFNASVTFSDQQSHYIPFHNYVFLRTHDLTDTAELMDAIMNQPSISSLPKEKLEEYVLEQKNWGSDNFIEMTKDARKKSIRLQQFIRKRGEKRASRVIQRWFAKYEHKFQDYKWIKNQFEKFKGYEVTYTDKKVFPREIKEKKVTELPLGIYSWLCSLCRKKYIPKGQIANRDIIIEFLDRRINEICDEQKKKMEDDVNYYFVKEKHSYFNNFKYILKKMYKSNMLVKFWDQKKLNLVKDNLKSISITTRQRNIVFDRLIEDKVDPMYLNPSVHLPPKLRSILKNDLNLTISRTDYMVIAANHILDRLNKWTKCDDGKWIYEDTETVKESDEVSSLLNVTVSQDISFTIKRKSRRLTDNLDVQNNNENMNRHININDTSVQNVRNFLFSNGKKLTQESLRLRNEGTKIICTPSSFEALLSMQDKISLLQDVDSKITEIQKDIYHLRNAEAESESISNNKIIELYQESISKLESLRPKTIPSLVKKLETIKNDVLWNGNDSVFVDSIIDYCMTQFELELKFNGDSELEKDIEMKEKKLKDHGLSSKKKKKIQNELKKLYKQRTCAPNIYKTDIKSEELRMSFDKEAMKLYKADKSQKINEADEVSKLIASDSDDSDSSSDSDYSDSDSDSDSSDYDTDDSDDDSDDEIEMGVFAGESSIMREDKQKMFGKVNFTPKISLSTSEKSLKKKGKGKKNSLTKQNFKVLTLSGLHKDILYEVKKLINFGACKKTVINGDDVITFTFRESNSKRKNGAIQPTVESLVKIIHKSLHEVNKNDDTYIIDDLIAVKKKRMKDLEEKIKKERNDDRKHKQKKTHKNLKKFVEYFEDYCVNKIFISSSLSTDISVREFDDFVTDNPNDTNLRKIVEHEYDSESDDEDDANYSSLGVRINDAGAVSKLKNLKFA